MKVSIVSTTKDPLNVISMAAGTSYGKDDVSEKRVVTCFKRGHLSVFEHASFTVRIEGISRACSHQLVRHRLASFVQKSQRYTKIDTETDWFVKPEAFGAGEDDPVLGMEPDEFFYCCMLDAARNYNDALKAGIKPEDARYLLPEATKTEITMTMNCRELFTFLDLRTDKAAQWEIRELANRIKALFGSAAGEQWAFIIDLWNRTNGKHASNGKE